MAKKSSAPQRLASQRPASCHGFQRAKSDFHFLSSSAEGTDPSGSSGSWSVEDNLPLLQKLIEAFLKSDPNTTVCGELAVCS
jgi:hypothetical protein